MIPSEESPPAKQRAYPARLHHAMPTWVSRNPIYHIRLRSEVDAPVPLTDPTLGPRLLQSAQFYHRHERWHCRLMLLMPDHAHALLSFPGGRPIGDVVGAWKAYTTRHLGVRWQTNFFDHRVRDHRSLQEKGAYIRRNPVAKGLCTREEDWLWVWLPSGVE